MSISLPSSEVTARIVETLGHSLWQGALIALLLYLLLRMLPARSARARYIWSLVALVALVLTCLVTWNLSEPRGTQGGTSNIHSRDVVSPLEASAGDSRHAAGAASETAILSSSPARSNWRTLLLITWYLGAAFGLLRLFLAVAGDRRLRRISSEPDGSYLAEQLSAIAAKLKVRQRVRVLFNPDLVIPAVSGLFRPVNLIPSSMATGVPSAYLEAVLAHELAHIRRHDYLVNLAQMTVEALLFFNPAVWWISRQIRREREACCDALAIQVVGEPCIYARALATVAEVSLTAQNRLAAAPALAMAGEPGDKGQLLERVRRTLSPDERPGLRLSWPSTIVFLTASFLVLAVLRVTTGAAIDILTPEERVKKAEELQKQYPNYEIERVERNSRDGKREQVVKISLSGRVISTDGSALPKGIRLIGCTEQGNFSSYFSIPVGDNGEFRCDCDSGTVTLMAQVEGWAPKYLRLGKVAEERAKLEIKLEKGYSSSLQFLSPEKVPLAGVEVKLYSEGPPNSPTIEARSGADGIVRLEHMASEPLSVSALLPGYQRARWDKLEPPAGQTKQLTLYRATVFRGTILDAMTGVPVQGAEIRICTDSRVSYGDDGPVVGSSGRDGRFVLDTLQDDAEVQVLVSAKNYLGQVLDITAQEPPLVRLTPGPTVRVEVRGVDPKQLNRNKELTLYYGYTITTRSEHSVHHNGADSELSAKVQNGIAVLEVPLVYKSETEFRVGGRRFEYTWAEMTDGRAVYILDLKEPEKKTPAAVDPATFRKVKIEFKTPKDSPPANGKLAVTYVTNPGGKTRAGESKVVEVINGIAQLEVPTPNDLNFGPEGLQGYWFRSPFRMEVPVGSKEQPVSFSIDAQPAGAVYGEIFDAEGKPAEGVLISAIVVPGHKMLENGSVNVSVKSSASGNDDSSRFIASPLPFGGKFIIAASSKNSRVFSEPLAVDERTPFHQIRLQFPAGETIQGKVIRPDSEPARNTEIGILLETSGMGTRTFGNRGAITDGNGEFRIEGVNSKVSGKYFLEVEKARGMQPVRMEAVFGRSMEIRLQAGLTLSGVVKEAGTGRVIPGAEIYAVAPETLGSGQPLWLNAAGLTDKQGRFYFDQLPPGKYEIRSRSGNPIGSEVIATAGQKGEVTLELKLPPGSDLTPGGAE